MSDETRSSYSIGFEAGYRLGHHDGFEGTSILIRRSRSSGWQHPHSSRRGCQMGRRIIAPARSGRCGSA